MAKVLYVALQTPSVEMKIKSEPDCAGKTETLTAVFTRHNTAEAEKIRNKMADIQRQNFTDAVELAAEISRVKEYFSYLTGAELEVQVAEGKERFLAGKTFVDSPEALRISRKKQEEDLLNLLRSQIIALKNVPLEIQETDESGKVTTSKLTVPDTRTAVDNLELWGDGANCLNALLDVLLLSNPWSSSLARAQQNVLYNLQILSDASAKNS
jgi:hypothetical protein